MKTKLIIIIFTIASCIACAGNQKHSYPTVNFIVRNNFNGNVYLIHDPINGVEPEINQERKRIVFNDKGCVFLRNYTDVILRNTWIIVNNHIGDELYITKSGMAAGRGKLTVVSFIIADTLEELRRLLSNKSILSIQEQLFDIGVDISVKN